MSMVEMRRRVTTLSPLMILTGSNEYSRVLDYSIFKSLLVPYSKNFTTRPSSRVVAIFTFFVRIIQISKKWKSNTSMMTSCNNPNNVHLPLSWNSCTKRGIKIQNTPKLGIWGGLASQFSWPLEACWYLISQIQTELLTQIPSYEFSATFPFLRQSINRLSQEKGK